MPPPAGDGVPVDWEDAGANHAYWDIADASPDRWTMMVLEREGEWVRDQYGMAEFVVAFLAGEIGQSTACSPRRRLPSSHDPGLIP
jgi:hypothetical protein